MDLKIEIKNKRFKTMALAGSKATDDKSAWKKKEIEEQEYVMRYIQDNLVELNIDFKQSELKTVVAGPVEHLQSTFIGKIESNKIAELVNKLHPTPAVCGIPKEKSKLLIQNTEKHFRADYTGFIGPVNNGDINLFVNLRSAIVTHNRMYLYIGGGITGDSIPEKEWKETELKAITLLNCYKNC